MNGNDRLNSLTRAAIKNIQQAIIQLKGEVIAEGKPMETSGDVVNWSLNQDQDKEFKIVAISIHKEEV